MTDRQRVACVPLLATLLVLALGSGSQVVLAHGDDEHAPEPSGQASLFASPAPSGETSEFASSAPSSSPNPSASPLSMSAAPLSGPSAVASLRPELLQATGIVLSVDSPALGRVNGFVLLTREGEQLAFDTSGLAFDPAFPVSHIAEHQMTSDPIKVTYTTNGAIAPERLVVIALADADAE